jgi:hypothetical protein|tara:strand:+ start:3042 stop:3929 length:888 start_codon:yes stop_codon:yes gene_type:complete
MSNNSPLKDQHWRYNVPEQDATGMSTNTSLLNQDMIGGDTGSNTFGSSFTGNMMNMAMRYNAGNLAQGGGTTGGGGGTGFLGRLSGTLEHAATPLGIGLSLASSVIGFRKARAAERKAKKQAKKSEAERKRQEDAYRSLDTSNPYMNMENTMEDLTINQKQSQFQREQFQQSQANILDSLRGSAGGSGVAALAQQLAQSGQLASQQAAADIGRQEAANQRAERAQAGQLQMMEREGDIYSRNLKREQTETLFGMAQQRAAADQTSLAQARQAKMDAITGGITGAASMFAGFGQDS